MESVIRSGIMHDPIPNRHALEELWRVRLEEARVAYERARNALREVRQEFGSEANAGGAYGVHQALRAENIALTEYLRVLRIFTDLVVAGKVPDGTLCQVQDRYGIWIIDADGRTAYANDRMAQILGTSPSALLGHDSFDYVFHEDAPDAQRLFAAKKHGDAESFRFRLRRKDGAAIWVEVQGTPMFNDGKFNGIVGTFRVTRAVRGAGGE